MDCESKRSIKKVGGEHGATVCCRHLKREREREREKRIKGRNKKREFVSLFRSLTLAL